MKLEVEAQVEGLVRTMKSFEGGASMGPDLCLFNVFIDDLELRDKTIRKQYS